MSIKHYLQKLTIQGRWALGSQLVSSLLAGGILILWWTKTISNLAFSIILGILVLGSIAFAYIVRDIILPGQYYGARWKPNKKQEKSLIGKKE